MEFFTQSNNMRWCCAMHYGNGRRELLVLEKLIQYIEEILSHIRIEMNIFRVWERFLSSLYQSIVAMSRKNHFWLVDSAFLFVFITNRFMNVYCSIVVEANRFPFRVIAFGFYWTFVLLPNGKSIDYDDSDDELDSDASSALKIATVAGVVRVKREFIIFYGVFFSTLRFHLSSQRTTVTVLFQAKRAHNTENLLPLSKFQSVLVLPFVGLFLLFFYFIAFFCSFRNSC